MMAVQESPVRLFYDLILRRTSLRTIFCARLIGFWMLALWCAQICRRFAP